MKLHKVFIIGLIIYLFSIAIKLPFPDADPLGITLASKSDLMQGYIYNGTHIFMISLILLLTSLALFSVSLDRFKTVVITLSFILAIIVPYIAGNYIEEKLAAGINAIHYDREESVCQFDVPNFPDNDIMSADCQLILENRGDSDADFTIEFEEDNNYRPVPLMNQDGPYHVQIKANEVKIITIELTIDVPEGEDAHIGGVQGPILIIRSGEEVREL